MGSARTRSKVASASESTLSVLRLASAMSRVRSGFDRRRRHLSTPRHRRRVPRTTRPPMRPAATGQSPRVLDQLAGRDAELDLAQPKALIVQSRGNDALPVNVQSDKDLDTTALSTRRPEAEDKGRPRWDFCRRTGGTHHVHKAASLGGAALSTSVFGQVLEFSGRTALGKAPPRGKRIYVNPHHPACGANVREARPSRWLWRQPWSCP